jgi:hypothetical protein
MDSRGRWPERELQRTVLEVRDSANAQAVQRRKLGPGSGGTYLKLGHCLGRDRSQTHLNGATTRLYKAAGGNRAKGA